ncbi:phosphotransferase family protein [Paenibacillus lautus]|uniref:phosphotransferase family protein n=1 Tax=Paenibacillus lautus TaxID=1401 RepID=UPI002DBC9FFE|nr:aminoglycoside phosphotransferase family protein [Paenibacillus lautus]MEC0257374.1 aminoglycoside phosphotransferase family protein [Paenibacillus lautus]
MNLEDLITEVYGSPPLKIERMSFGHTNQVYNVTFSDEQIILRTNHKPGVLKHTADNIAILSSLGLPVPNVIRTDVSLEKVPFAYMILEHFPGRDLRYELEGMTREQLAELAQQIISYQRSVSELPRGSGFGWVPIGEQGPFSSWTQIIERDISSHIDHIVDEVTPETIVLLQKMKQRYTPYFDRVEPVCFLDDLTIKNVIVAEGKLQGIVDFDWVCYGDPLYMIALTQTAVVSDIGDQGMPYVEALCRQWGANREQLALIDFYSVIHALQFIGFHQREQNDVCKQRMVSFILDKINSDTDENRMS